MCAESASMIHPKLDWATPCEKMAPETLFCLLNVEHVRKMTPRGALKARTARHHTSEWYEKYCQ